MPRTEKEYDPAYDPPNWWLDELRRVLGLGSGVKTWERVDLAEHASSLAGRKWDGTRITKLLKRQNPTMVLVQAISAAASITPPIFEARSKEEAEDFLRIRRQHDARADGEINPETLSKVSRIAQRLEHTVAEVTASMHDQTDALNSKDERSPRGRGHRRASDRR